MQFGLDEWTLSQITDTLKKFSQVKKVIIFGSRAKGTFKNYSDIDLAIYAPAMTEEQFGQFFVALEALPLLYKIDIVRMETLSNDVLRAKIETEGVILFNSETR